MQRFACLDLTENWLEVVIKAGTLHAGDVLLINEALHVLRTWTSSLAQLIPSTEGISNLYTPCLFVVLLTENDICSVVLGEAALNLQSILTSAPVVFFWWVNTQIQSNFQCYNYNWEIKITSYVFIHTIIFLHN